MNTVAESPPVYPARLATEDAALNVELSNDGELDLSLIDHCLSLTPWERMLANDAALNFAAELQEAVGRRHDIETVMHLKEIKKRLANS